MRFPPVLAHLKVMCIRGAGNTKTIPNKISKFVEDVWTSSWMLIRPYENVPLGKVARMRDIQYRRQRLWSLHGILAQAQYKEPMTSLQS